MDVIFLKELQVETIIGVFEWEKRIKQTVLIDIEVFTEINAAAASDQLADTIDYKKISKRIKEFAESRTFNLIETLAKNIADMLIGEFDVRRTRVTVSKPRAIRGSKTVGVIVHRGDKPG